VVLFLVLAIAALVRGAAGAHDTDAAVPTSGASPVSSPASSNAAGYLAQLDALTVGTVDSAGYARSEFGDGWKDPDHNGCDARNDILARDLEATSFKPGTSDCVVTSGTLHDPYTGTTIAFIRGDVTSEAVQIDHIVPLSWSWSHGAASWTDDERQQFANDPTNLRAVDGPTNGSKSDSGPADWMPPSASFACTYVEGFVEVLSAYRLSVDASDAQAMRVTLAAC
jgi:Protein of unknown function (DUF1524)